jgi:hypothetical protein
MAADLLTTVCAEIDARLRELAPAVAEYRELISVDAALGDGDRKAHAPRTNTVAPPSRPAAGKALPKAPRQRRQPAPARRKAVSAGEPTVAGASPSDGGAPREAAQLAIVAALEHGSHTVGELSVVTAMSGASIREGLRGLSKAGRIVRAKRDGKAAYALI